MARPKTNLAVPAVARLAKSRAGLAATGGQRLDVNLSARAAADLAVVMSSHALNTKKEAVEIALRNLAAAVETVDRIEK